jgi:nitrogen fixation protein NifU and related proteins
MSYSKKVLDLFNKPRNAGKMKDYDGIGKVGNPVCGDVMWLYIKVKDEVIKDITFETFGCIAALASSSIITDMVKGRSIDDALKIVKEDVLNELDGLPPVKVHCSVLSVDALQEAIYNYLSKNNKTISESLEKKHQELEIERKQVEEKYKDWVQKEEELHEE